MALPTTWHVPTREVLRILAIIFGFYVALRLLWIAHPVIFLFFLGVLFGLPLAQGGNWFKKRGIPRGVGVAIILTAFLGLLIGGGVGMAPMLRTQSKELRQRLPEAMDKIDNWLGHHANGVLGMFVSSDSPADSAKNSIVVDSSAGPLVQKAAPAADSTAIANDTILAGSNLRRDLAHQFQGAQHSFLRVLTSTFAITGAFMLVLFIAAYIGADPALYHGGILEMFPVADRPRIAMTLRRVAVVLRRWLVTQLIAMLVIGAVTTLFLVVLHVKAALPLGILAGVFKFIPIVGSIFAAVPAVAMAFIDSPHKALVVGIGYIAIQFIENHLLVPVLMKKGVNLPPAMTLGVQALMSLLFGFLGLLVAVPLLAAVVAIARSLNADEMREVSAQADAVVDPEPDAGMAPEPLSKTS
jgi:predicted PurR-regulated permease PerM